jgi:Flp pilus assembly protein CpaB
MTTAALAAVLLAACSAHSSTSSAARVPDPKAPDADLPEIVITAHALSPDERLEESAQDSKAQELPVPADIARDQEATARKPRVTNVSDESG